VIVELYPDGPPRPCPDPEPGAPDGAMCAALVYNRDEWGWEVYREGRRPCKNRAVTTRGGQPYCRAHAPYWSGRSEDA
jgi:hypothetical protein